MLWKRLLLLFAPVLFALAPAQATVFGSVRGIVHDPDHRPIPGAQVALRARNSDCSVAAQTNSEGEFSFPAVLLGEYRVIVSSEGFSPMEQQVVVVSGAAPVLHFQLKLAAARETEDQYKLRPWLTLTAGVRLTHFSGALSENAASPRLGVALRIPGWNWRLSAPPFLRRLRLRQRGQQQGVALLQRSAAERQAFPHGRRQSRTSQATPDDS